MVMVYPTAVQSRPQLLVGGLESLTGDSLLFLEALDGSLSFSVALLKLDHEKDKSALRQRISDLEEQLEVAKRSVPLNGMNASLAVWRASREIRSSSWRRLMVA
jgi:hypothetical protein